MSTRPFHRFLQLNAGGARVSDLAFYTETIQHAESRGFDAVVLHSSTHLDDQAPDPLTASTLEPITLLSAVAAVTTEIGLVAPVSTSLTQPYAIARRLSALDFVSSGRAGWEPVVSQIEAERANLGWAELNVEQAHERAAEYIEVVANLWHSWGAEARVIDKESGLYLDLEQISPVDFHGHHFQVAGPIDSPRPPQGNPVLVSHEPAESWSPALARAVDVVIGGPETDTAITQALRAVGRPRSDVRLISPWSAEHVETAVELHEDGVIDGVAIVVEPGTAPAKELIDRAGAASVRSVPALRTRLGLAWPAERFVRITSVAQLQPTNG